eukprot:TRINITY_DN5862_c0_g1_i1.p1 TRINITY_DN5862_c0_g1~~TRINITY_DN5862_c0_g1_i1.p1  ORF type:complete len:242 (-),score=54.65 TRINITY_DN5862_c0_g1_i1:81-755(-)
MSGELPSSTNGAFVLIRDESGPASHGDFLLHHYLAQSPASSKALVVTSRMTHFTNILAKKTAMSVSGVVNSISVDNVTYIKPTFTSDNFLRNIYTTIKRWITEGATAPSLIIALDGTSFLQADGDIEEIKFIAQILALLNSEDNSNLQVVLRMTNTASNVQWNWLLHKANIVLDVSTFSSGYSKVVHGEVRVFSRQQEGAIRYSLHSQRNDQAVKLVVPGSLSS